MAGGYGEPRGLSLHQSKDGPRRGGHLAKANAQAPHLESPAKALAIFAAPHAYVSPSNYEPGNWVPTWNYLAVHAYGAPVVAEDREAKLAILSRAVTAFEPGYQRRLRLLPTGVRGGEAQGIVAFEIRVWRIEARWKLSQDRKPAERDRIRESLAASDDAMAVRLAGYMVEAGRP